jgi:hypothetical protein
MVASRNTCFVSVLLFPAKPGYRMLSSGIPQKNPLRPAYEPATRANETLATDWQP